MKMKKHFRNGEKTEQESQRRRRRRSTKGTIKDEIQSKKNTENSTRNKNQDVESCTKDQGRTIKEDDQKRKHNRRKTVRNRYGWKQPLPRNRRCVIPY
jgi:hypothetical protein